MPAAKELRRRYVRVRCEVDERGFTTPTAVVWRNGAVYEIQKIRNRTRPKQPNYEGLIRYDILVGKDGFKATSLFFDGRRWFVELQRRPGDGLQ